MHFLLALKNGPYIEQAAFASALGNGEARVEAWRGRGGDEVARSSCWQKGKTTAGVKGTRREGVTDASERQISGGGKGGRAQLKIRANVKSAGRQGAR